MWRFLPFTCVSCPVNERIRKHAQSSSLDSLESMHNLLCFGCYGLLPLPPDTIIQAEYTLFYDDFVSGGRTQIRLIRSTVSNKTLVNSLPASLIIDYLPVKP